MDKRDNIIEAACAAIADLGVADLTVAHVAARAGVSTALVYYHFSTKQQLLAAACERFATRRSDGRSRALAADGLAALDALWSVLVGGTGADAERAWNDLTLLGRRDAAVRRILAAERASESSALATRLPQLLEDLGSRLAVPADEAAAVVLHFLDGVALALAGAADGEEVRAAYDAFWLVLVTAGQARARRGGT